MNDKAEANKTSDFYKLKEGSNRMRILTDFTRVESINQGKVYKGILTPSNRPQEGDSVALKGWAWAIIRESGELGIVQFGKTILGLLSAYKINPEYTFDGFPMPYDVDIQAKGAGTKEVEYAVVPARQNSEVTPEEMEMLNKKTPIREIVQKITDKQDGKVSPAKATMADVHSAANEGAPDSEDIKF